MPVHKEQQKYVTKFCHKKVLVAHRFFFGNSATGHFLGKLLPKILSSDDVGSNDTGLKSVSGPGTESIKCQTECGYYNIDVILVAFYVKFFIFPQY
jgi:hypothetical protein